MLRRHGFIVRSVRFAGHLAVLGAAAAAAPARAMDLPSLVGRAAGASQATVYLVPPMALFRSALDEVHMQSAGCRYATSDPAAIHALVALIAAADVHDDTVFQMPDMREGVYLTLADGSLLKFFLQDNYGGRLPVRGIAATSADGDLQSVSVTARQSLALDLRRWAAASGGSGTGSACDRQSAALPPPR